MPKTLAYIALLIVCSSANAEHVLNFIVDNDVFTGTDRHYTSGVMLNYISGIEDGPRRLRDLGIRFPGIEPEDEMHVSISLGHELYTPNNIDATELLEDQRPYAGFAYLSAGFSTANPKEVETWLVTAGLVGPGAAGERIQNTVHRAIETSEAMGWRNQLDNEWVLSVAYEKKWLNRAWTRSVTTDIELDMIPHVIASVGTPHTFAGLGATFRFGQGLQKDHGPPKVRPSMPDSQFYEFGHYSTWYFFLGLESRLIAHNLFLDGNNFRDSHSVDREDWVSDLQAGFVWTNRRFRVGYTYVIRSREFKDQDERDIFGSLTLSAHF